MCQTLSDAFDADLFGGCEVKKKQKHAKLFMNAGFFLLVERRGKKIRAKPKRNRLKSLDARDNEEAEVTCVSSVCIIDSSTTSRHRVGRS